MSSSDPLSGTVRSFVRYSIQYMVELWHSTFATVLCVVGRYSRYSDSLRAGRYGGRNPVGARLSAPVQTGPGAHIASYTVGTESFPGVKRPGRGVDHPPPI